MTHRSDTPEICVSIADDAWLDAVPDSEAVALRAAEAALAATWPGLGPVGIGIVLGDDAQVQALSRQWRGQDKPTNVLSFPATDAAPDTRPTTAEDGMPLELGDVVLAHGTCRREAQDQDKPLARHLEHLVVHGVLHLLGYDHLTEAEAERMEQLETRILAGLGAPDPYHVREQLDG